VNYRGVGAGTLLSNTTVGGEAPGAGTGVRGWRDYLSVSSAHRDDAVDANADGWLKPCCCCCFAYGGYEAALNPMV